MGSEAYSPAGTTPMRPKRRTSRSSSTRAVVERPPGPHVGVELARPEPQLPGHAEVDDQLAVVVEREQQVLAPAARPTRWRRPAANGADENLADGCPHPSVIRRPTTSGSSWRRTVSTSGSSGTPSSMPAAAASQAGVATAVAVAVTVVPSDAPGIALAKT